MIPTTIADVAAKPIEGLSAAGRLVRAGSRTAKPPVAKDCRDAHGTRDSITSLRYKNIQIADLSLIVVDALFSSLVVAPRPARGHAASPPKKYSRYRI